MDQDLADYICTYCTEFYNEKEKKASRHHTGQLKYSDVTDDYPPLWKKMRDNNITTDPEALALLKDGYDAFVLNTARRIYRDHASQLKLNLCPQCYKIARTPLAKQCRFCGHDWH